MTRFLLSLDCCLKGTANWKAKLLDPLSAASTPVFSSLCPAVGSAIIHRSDEGPRHPPKTLWLNSIQIILTEVLLGALHCASHVITDLL